MSNDLEAEIREALHSRAMTVTADDLGRRDEPRPTGRRPLLSALAAAAAIAALAVGIALAAGSGGQDGRQPSAVGGANLTGIDWRLVKGTVGTTTEFRTPNDEPRITFNSDGTFGADDSINYLSGKYRWTSTGLVLSDVASTAVGYAGHDRAVIATA